MKSLIFKILFQFPFILATSLEFDSNLYLHYGTFKDSAKHSQKELFFSLNFTLIRSLSRKDEVNEVFISLYQILHVSVGWSCSLEIPHSQVGRECFVLLLLFSPLQ